MDVRPGWKSRSAGLEGPGRRRLRGGRPKKALCATSVRSLAVVLTPTLGVLVRSGQRGCARARRSTSAAASSRIDCHAATGKSKALPLKRINDLKSNAAYRGGPNPFLQLRIKTGVPPFNCLRLRVRGARSRAAGAAAHREPARSSTRKTAASQRGCLAPARRYLALLPAAKSPHIVRRRIAM